MNIEEQIRIIKKGVDKLVDEEELQRKLETAEKEGKRLIVKLGLDPSAPDIHLGHAVVLRKIKLLQDLGHKAVIIIGDFTGRIGDPTGKSQGRKALSEEDVLENAKTYTKQIFKILNKDKTEFFYPIMQAYDSVAIHADIELGGTDQTFNILMGRTLQKAMGEEQQIAIFMPILEGMDGKEKMSKSLGNYIGINEPAYVMFKKVMEIPDDLIIKYFELATDIHPDTIHKIKNELMEGKNPKDIKLLLAETITALYHTKEELEEAITYFKTAFEEKNIPDNIPELIIELENDLLKDIIPLLVKEKYVQSNSEFRRLLLQGGIQVNQEKEVDLDMVLACGDVIKIGKKRFVKIIK